MSSSSSYLLRPAPPIRAFGLAGILAIVGAVVIVLAAENGWPAAVPVIGWILVGLCVLLIAGAVLAMFRLRVHANFDKTGYHIQSQRGTVDGPWLDVTKVTLSGPRLIIVRRTGEPHEVLTPQGDKDPESERMLREMTARLHDRYGI